MLRVRQNPVLTNIMLDCLDHLQFDIGIAGSSLNCIESYQSLTEPSVSLYIIRVLLNIFNLKFGVHKAAVHDHFIFSMQASF